MYDVTKVGVHGTTSSREWAHVAGRVNSDKLSGISTGFSTPTFSTQPNLITPTLDIRQKDSKEDRIYSFKEFCMQ